MKRNFLMAVAVLISGVAVAQDNTSVQAGQSVKTDAGAGLNKEGKTTNANVSASTEIAATTDVKSDAVQNAKSDVQSAKSDIKKDITTTKEHISQQKEETVAAAKETTGAVAQEADAAVKKVKPEATVSSETQGSLKAGKTIRAAAATRQAAALKPAVTTVTSGVIGSAGLKL